MYANGQVPLDRLVTRPTLTKDFCLMMPGTAAKHDRLVFMAENEYGWTPKVTGPDDGYRTLAAQRHYFETMPGGMAAYPGTSSHGGTYNFGDGRGEIEQGAVDYGNFSIVGERIFFDLARRAGFLPNYFDGNGVPDEPWHVFDPSPWDVPTPVTPKEDDMPVASVSINGNLYGVDTEYISHYGTTLQADITRQVSSATDELHDLGSGPKGVAKFGALLDGLGIPQDVLDGQGRVLNPETGRYESNGVWSRNRQVVAQNARILKKLGA